LRSISMREYSRIERVALNVSISVEAELLNRFTGIDCCSFHRLYDWIYSP